MNELPRSAGHHCAHGPQYWIVHINIRSEGRAHFKCSCHSKIKIKKERVRNTARPDSEAHGVLLCPAPDRHPRAPMGAGAGGCALSGSLKRGDFSSALCPGHRACHWPSPGPNGGPWGSSVGRPRTGFSGPFHSRQPAALSFHRHEAEAKVAPGMA